MSSPARPSRYAPTPAAERRLLSQLDFLDAAQRAYISNESIPLQKIRDELHRVAPQDMAILDARITAGPQPSMPAPPHASTLAPSRAAAERAADLAKLDAAFDLDAAPTDSAGVRYERNVLQFGV